MPYLQYVVFTGSLFGNMGGWEVCSWHQNAEVLITWFSARLQFTIEHVGKTRSTETMHGGLMNPRLLFCHSIGRLVSSEKFNSLSHELLPRRGTAMLPKGLGSLK